MADTIDELIEGHTSIDRALVQVLMPRMSLDELKEIVTRGLSYVGMSIPDPSLNSIAFLAQGLPHYAHLLGLHAALEAVRAGYREISPEHVQAALRTAVAQARESIQHAYHQATTSPRRENLYKQVLLACALARVDDLGYFAPSDVRDPMTRIMKKPYDIPSFIRHLNDLSSGHRGYVLEKIGPERRRRFCFTDPLLKPYVVHRGLVEGMIDTTM